MAEGADHVFDFLLSFGLVKGAFELIDFKFLFPPEVVQFLDGVHKELEVIQQAGFDLFVYCFHFDDMIH